MSNLVKGNLVSQYIDVVSGLSRGQPVSVCLPNGTVVTGVPEQIEVEGQTLVQINVSVESGAGPVEAQIRMRPDTYQVALEKARDMTPRLVAMQERRQLMLNRRNGED